MKGHHAQGKFLGVFGKIDHIYFKQNIYETGYTLGYILRERVQSVETFSTYSHRFSSHTAPGLGIPRNLPI